MSNEEKTGGFRVTEVPKSGLFNRVRGKISREAAFVELRNLLAVTPFDALNRGDVAAILEKARLVPQGVPTELAAVYEDAVLGVAADGELSDEDRRGLAQLATCFELKASELELATERAVGHVYLGSLRRALADETFTIDKRTEVDAKAQALGMTDGQRQKLYDTAATQALMSVLSGALTDGRYTATEEQHVQAFAARLGVTIRHDEETARIVSRCRLLAQIDDGQPPNVDVPILLQRGEVCHFAASDVTYKEMRTVTKRVNYGGPTASVRIMKGVRWRFGSIAVQRVTQDVLTEVDKVDMYITNKRLFLRGGRKNTSVPLTKVAHFTLFSDGLQVEKDTGKDLFLVGEADWEVAAGCLEVAARAGR